MKNKIYLYEKVYDAFRQQILSGTLVCGALLPSEQQIGKLFAVDRTTVRKALQLLVEDGLVQKKAGKGTIVTGEEPVVLPNGAKDSIAFFLPKNNHNSDRITQPFYATLFYAIEKTCRQQNYNLIYSTLDEQDDFDAILAGNVFSGIVFVSNVPKHMLDRALEKKIPSILINCDYEKIPCVLSDNFEGTYLACRHLIEHGHREIGVIQGIPEYTTTRDRLRGCLAALQESGLILRREHNLQAEWDYESGYHAVCMMLDKVSRRPTALVAFNDHLALGAIRAVNEHGLHVPEDISIVGFDNIEQTQYSNPRLTTVNVNTALIGEFAMSCLLRQMSDGNTLPVKMLTPVCLVERDSTAYANAK